MSHFAVVASSFSFIRERQVQICVNEASILSGASPGLADRFFTAPKLALRILQPRGKPRRLPQAPFYSGNFVWQREWYDSLSGQYLLFVVFSVFFQSFFSLFSVFFFQFVIVHVMRLSACLYMENWNMLSLLCSVPPQQQSIVSYTYIT